MNQGHLSTMEVFFSEKRGNFLREAEQQVVRALDLLDHDLGRDYRKAMAEVPELVKEESRIIDFLRTEGYNTFQAAVRLANYWKLRREVFGPHRWLLPLRQKEGALDSISVEVLKTGYVVFMTKPQPVIFADFSRLPEGVSYAQAQVLFYLLSVNTCESVQTDGVTSFHIISSRPRPLVMPDGDLTLKLHKSMPFRMKQNIVAKVHESLFEHLLDYRCFGQERVCDFHRRAVGQASYEVASIRGNSQRETIQLLEQRGMQRNCLPFEYGGELDLSQVFSAWMRQRLTLEGAATQPLLITANPATAAASSTSLTCSVSSKTKKFKLTSSATKSSPPSSSASAEKQGAVVERLPNETWEDFRKRRNIIYGRRNADKERRRIEEMDHQRQVLALKNQSLVRDNERLERLLAQAQTWLSQKQNSINVNTDLFEDRPPTPAETWADRLLNHFEEHSEMDLSGPLDSKLFFGATLDLDTLNEDLVMDLD